MGRLSAELFQGVLYRVTEYPSGMTIYTGKSIDKANIGIGFTNTGGYYYGEPLDDIVYGAGTVFRAYKDDKLLVYICTSEQNRVEIIKIKLVDAERIIREDDPIGDYEILSF